MYCVNYPIHPISCIFLIMGDRNINYCVRIPDAVFISCIVGVYCIDNIMTFIPNRLDGIGNNLVAYCTWHSYTAEGFQGVYLIKQRYEFINIGFGNRDCGIVGVNKAVVCNHNVERAETTVPGNCKLRYVQNNDRLRDICRKLRG